MKAIIFDMDGVLINTEPLHFKCWKVLMEEDGINLTYDIYKPCIGSTREYLIQLLEERFGKLKRDPDELLKKMQQKKKEIVERDGFPFLSGVKEAVSKFKEAGYILAVASSSPTDVIEETLNVLDVRECFRSITSGREVAEPKPAPDIFLRAMEKLGVSPQECLIIEDSTNGGKAAKAAGAKCVWYHNPDSGDQNIPYAELEIGEWNAENVNKLIQIMKEN